MLEWASLLTPEQVATNSKITRSKGTHHLMGYTELGAIRTLAKLVHVTHWKHGEEKEGICLLCFETAEIYEQSWNAHLSTMQSLSGEHRLAHSLCTLMYTKHKRHSVTTFVLYLSNGEFEQDIPILTRKTKPMYESDLVWSWVFLPRKLVVSFQMWVRTWISVWAICWETCSCVRDWAMN